MTTAIKDTNAPEKNPYNAESAMIPEALFTATQQYARIAVIVNAGKRILSDPA
ncbi:uncharacterized protein TrAFT101_003180 [Trichoderma asperellum]|uniref:uncharacterized protein n=1 Tax=Trichoderma asperellum TaxID=101201 RepID=UPI00332FE290|nr:hypothetical protein TrAFT101_003180 [Trichoderma asperellum]